MNRQTACYFCCLCSEVTEEFPVGAVSPSIRPLLTSEAPAEALSPTSGMDATFLLYLYTNFGRTKHPGPTEYGGDGNRRLTTFPMKPHDELDLIEEGTLERFFIDIEKSHAKAEG